MMTPERWGQVKSVLQDALELMPEQRPGFLERACTSDASLRSEVESLLAVEEQAKGFLKAGRAADSLLAIDSRLKQLDTDGDGDPTPPRARNGNPKRDRGELQRLDLRLIRGTSTGQTLEIRDLLRRRLQIIVLLALAANGFITALRLVRLERPLFTDSTVLHIWAPAALNLVVLAVLTAILWRKRIYPLAQLRWLELATFGIATLYFLGETYTVLFIDQGGWLVTFTQRFHPSEINLLSRHPSILWVMLIISYGTFIPNTGRRCAAITTTMALSHLSLVAFAGLLHPEIPRRVLAYFLGDMAVWMGLAVAIAIYGSQKITVLRQEALAARKLGQYDLKQRLGRGGMGEVYLAEHVLLKRPCAVKVIRADQADNPSSLKRFLREVQVTATLTHPNTVQIFDYGQADDGTVFYAMEYLPGLNLQRLVEQYGPLDPRRAVHILRQLCSALAEAHAIGLIHRDIKPTNVILCSRGGVYDVAKLLDFGLVRLQAADPAQRGVTQVGLIFGTPAYMSPEQASGKQELDARSDIYSLAALAFFLLAGEPPFVRNGVVQTLAAHINEDVPLLRSRRPELSQELEALVKTCLAKDPDMRLQTVIDLDKELSKCELAGNWTQAEAREWWLLRTNERLDV